MASSCLSIRLSISRNEFRCITYDRRGHGKTELTPYGYSLHNQTLDLTELLDKLQVSRPIIVAVAMATPIAVSFALAFPIGSRAWRSRLGMNWMVIR
jgi:pimeloyl-ACP methyl ester carboxylesterase